MEIIYLLEACTSSACMGILIPYSDVDPPNHKRVSGKLKVESGTHPRGRSIARWTDDLQLIERRHLCRKILI